jgi:hypothetical protein
MLPPNITCGLVFEVLASNVKLSGLRGRADKRETRFGILHLA